MNYKEWFNKYQYYKENADLSDIDFGSDNDDYKKYKETQNNENIICNKLKEFLNGSIVYVFDIDKSDITDSEVTFWVGRHENSLDVFSCNFSFEYKNITYKLSLIIINWKEGYPELSDMMNCYKGKNIERGYKHNEFNKNTKITYTISNLIKDFYFMNKDGEVIKDFKFVECDNDNSNCVTVDNVMIMFQNIKKIIDDDSNGEGGRRKKKNPIVPKTPDKDLVLR